MADKPFVARRQPPVLRPGGRAGFAKSGTDRAAAPPPPEAAEPAPPDAPKHAPAPALEAFLSEGKDDRIVDLLAYALAADRHASPPPAPTPEGRRRAKGRGAAPTTDDAPTDAVGWRAKARSLLHDHAMHTLHNEVDRIRSDAVKEALGRMRRGPGFLLLAFANVVALALAAVLLLALLAERPELLGQAGEAWRALLASLQALLG